MEEGRIGPILIGLAVVVLVAALGARTYYSVGILSHVTVVNRSAEAISSAQLRQGDRETVLGRIEPGQMRSADFVAQPGSLTLTVTFGSGRTLSAADVGYVAPATGVVVTFNVTDDKVALLDVVKRNPSNYSKR